MCILPDLIGFLRRVIKWMLLSGLYYVVFMHNATLVDNSSIPKKVAIALISLDPRTMKIAAVQIATVMIRSAIIL